MKSKELVVVDQDGVRRKRRRWSRAEKERLVERWCESGLSRMEFCRREELCYSRFLKWVEQASGGEDQVQFVQVVEGDAAREPACRLEVMAPNGWKVSLDEQFSAGALERLLEIVARC